MRSLFGNLLGAPSARSRGAALLERLVSATQLEDRREAIADFKDLTTTEPVRLIDRGGMSVLVQLLREEDTQLTRDILETLSNLLDVDVPKDAAESSAEVAAMHNASVFLTHNSNVTDVLNSSEDPDLYVRFFSVQVVMKLLSLARRQTQEAVLDQPATVSRILGLIEDRREIVRNDVLLLLGRLGEGNSGLQNILAFQGAFEQLLGVIEKERAEEESGASSVIVHDCIRLISSLLAANDACGRFFRESGCLERVPPLLVLPAHHQKNHAITVQLACVLLSHVLSSGIPAREADADVEATHAKRRADLHATQEALHRLRVIPMLVGLVVDAATATYPSLRVQAMGTLGSLVRGHTACADELLASRITRKEVDGTISEPALYRMLFVGLRSSSAVLRAATGHLFQCTFHEHTSAQLSASSSLSNPSVALPAAPAAAPAATWSSGAEPESIGKASGAALRSFAQLALSTLLDTGNCESCDGEDGSDQVATAAVASSAWLASSVLSALMSSNGDVKRLLLRLPAVYATVSPASADALAPSAAPASNGTPSTATGSGSGTLLQWVARRALHHARASCQSSTGASSSLLALALLRLLLEWLLGCTEATAAFIRPTANLPTVLQALSRPTTLDVHVAGHVIAVLSAALIGSPEASDMRPLLLQMVTERVGLEAYSNMWDEMRQAPAFAAGLSGAAEWPAVDAEPWLAGEVAAHGVVLYGGSMASTLQRLHDDARLAILKTCASADMRSPSASVGIDGPAKSALAGMPPTQVSCAGLASAAAAGTFGSADPGIESFKALIVEQDERHRLLQYEAGELQTRVEALEAELRIARAAAEEGDQLRASLEAKQQACERHAADAQSAREELASARAELSHTASELQAVSTAYAQLEVAIASRGSAPAGHLDGVAGGAAAEAAEPAHATAALSAKVALLEAHSEALDRDKVALVAKLAAAESACSELQRELDDSKAAVEEAGAHLKSVEAQAKADRDHATELRAELDASDAALREAEASVVSSLASKEMAEEQLAAMRERIRTAEMAQAEAEEIAAQMRAACGTPSGSIAAPSPANLPSQAISERNSDGASAPLAAAEARVCELEATVAELREEQEELLICLAEQDQEFEALADEYDAVRSGSTPGMATAGTPIASLLTNGSVHSHEEDGEKP